MYIIIYIYIYICIHDISPILFVFAASIICNTGIIILTKIYKYACSYHCPLFQFVRSILITETILYHAM